MKAEPEDTALCPPHYGGGKPKALDRPWPIPCGKLGPTSAGKAARAEVSEPAHGCGREGGHDAPAARKAELMLRLSAFEVPPLDEAQAEGVPPSEVAERVLRQAKATGWV